MTESLFLPGLRGAATLKSRALAKFSWSQEILKAGAQICTLMPSGERYNSAGHVSLLPKRLQ